MSLTTYRSEIETELNRNPKYRELLFRRGYLFTDQKQNTVAGYPYYGLWREMPLGPYFLYVQEQQTAYTRSRGNVHIGLIGHAYDPFHMIWNENDLCEALLDAYESGLTAWFDRLSDFTGLHVIILVDNDRVIACQDACSLTGCYFGTVNGTMYIAEHPQLIADLCGLSMDPMVEKLVQSKCYNIGNRHLPGNLTPYPGIKRLGANTFANYAGSFSIHRFYPVAPHPEYLTDEEKKAAIQRITELMHNGIACCTEKWNRCAISLSGGTDSKTTLACANGLYDRFSFFSFISEPQEKVDAEGAGRICKQLGLSHTVYRIPDENSSFPDFDLIKKILQHNTSYFVNLADNEIRKYITLHNLNAYDIELKSWSSEVTRVFLERKYQVRLPKTLNERHCSIFQTRYFGHPGLLRWSDREYYRFLREIGLEKPLFNYEHTDSFYWEIRMGCWGVSVISSQQLYHRMTIPMNNRKILEMFLGFPHEERKSDSVHKRVMNEANPSVLNAKVEIPNLYFHGYRIWMEKLYYYGRTLFYRPLSWQKP